MQTKDLLTEKRLRHLEEMVAEIGPEELRSKITNEELFKLVDVSDAAHFAQSHINDAINFPLVDLVGCATQHFRKFQQIVVYHHDAASGVATLAARQLQRSGFANVLVLKGGLQSWKDAGYDVVGEEPVTDINPAGA